MLWNIMTLGRRQRQLTQRAAEIADAMITTLLERAASRVAGMAWAEARGYLHARTTPILLAQLDALHGQGEFRARELEWLSAEIRQRVVRQVQDTLAQQSLRVRPLRRAA